MREYLNDTFVIIDANSLWDKKLKLEPWAVYMDMCFYRNPANNVCEVNLNELTKSRGLTEKVVKKAIPSLIKLGYISKENCEEVESNSNYDYVFYMKRFEEYDRLQAERKEEE